MGSSSVVGIITLALVTAAFLLFVAVELGGLALPGWHTISFMASHFFPLRIAILGAFLAMAVWWWWHSGQYVPK